MTRLEGIDLELGYGRRPVVSGVDLALGSGEFAVLIGPNGAGKSTLLRALAGLLLPRRGGVFLDGRDLRRIPARQRARRIACFLAGRSVPEGLTVAELVGMARYPWRGPFGAPGPKDGAAVARALERCGAADLAERPFHTLSSGERRRVLLARSLAQEAELLLLDEPAVNLDAAHRLEFFGLLRRWVDDEGGGVLAVTHDLNLASQFAGRVHLLADGGLVASGRPAEVVRPAVLERVYGTDLVFGCLPSAAAGEERPFVLPWRRVDRA